MWFIAVVQMDYDLVDLLLCLFSGVAFATVKERLSCMSTAAFVAIKWLAFQMS